MNLPNNKYITRRDEYIEEEMNSFLTSPKQDLIQFFNGTSNTETKLPINDSTMISASRSKAVSEYDVRCKICHKVYDGVESYIKHQSVCTGIQREQE